MGFLYFPLNVLFTYLFLYLDNLSKQLRCLYFLFPLPPSRPQHLTAFGVDGEEMSFLIYTELRGRETKWLIKINLQQSRVPWSPALDITLWVILAFYAYNKNRFGHRNQAAFMLNTAWNLLVYTTSLEIWVACMQDLAFSSGSWF